MRSLAKFFVLCVLVVALVLSFGIQMASADEILFPYFKVGGGTFSFLTLIDPLGNGIMNPNAPPTIPTIHYVFNYKDTVTNKCIHADKDGFTTRMDMMQQTVDSPSATNPNLPVLFGDYSIPGYLTVSPSEGFMIVNNLSLLEGNFYGQMIIVDSISGLVAAYKGLNDPLNSAPIGNFSSLITSHRRTLMNHYPRTIGGSPLVDTKWFVLVTGLNMRMMPGWGGTVNLTLNPIAGVWNRDEKFISGTKDKVIECFNTVSATDLLTLDQLNETVKGAFWQELALPRCDFSAAFSPACPAAGPPGLQQCFPGPSCNSRGVIMAKIESTSALGKPMSSISLENVIPNIPY